MKRVRAFLLFLALLTSVASAQDGPITLDHGKLSTDAGVLTVPAGSKWLRKDSSGTKCYAGHDTGREGVVYLMLISSIDAPLDQKFALEFAGGYVEGGKFSEQNVPVNVTASSMSFEFPVTKGKAYAWAHRIKDGTVVFLSEGGNQSDVVGLVNNYQESDHQETPPARASTSEASKNSTFLAIDLVTAVADFLAFIGIAILGFIIRYATQAQFNPVSIACNITWLLYGAEMFGLGVFAVLRTADAFSTGERLGYLLGGITLVVALPLAFVHFASFVIFRSIAKPR